MSTTANNAAPLPPEPTPTDTALSVPVLNQAGDCYLRMVFPQASGESLAEVHYRKKPTARQLRELASAHHFYFAALQKDPDSLHALHWLAFLQLFFGMQNEALDDAALLAMVKEKATGTPCLAELLGLYYEFREDAEKMIRWYKVAAQKNAVFAYHLARYCVDHRTHGQDAIEVLLPLKRFEDSEATCLIGLLYLHSIDVKPDRAKAKAMLRLAAEHSSREARKTLDSLFY